MAILNVEFSVLDYFGIWNLVPIAIGMGLGFYVLDYRFGGYGMRPFNPTFIIHN